MGSRSKGVSSRVRAGGMSARAGLTDNAWPFACSFAIHAALLAVLCLPPLQLPAQTNSPFPNVFWLSPLALPGDAHPTAALVDRSASAQTLPPETTVSEPLENYPLHSSTEKASSEEAPSAVEDVIPVADPADALMVSAPLPPEPVRASTPAVSVIKKSPVPPLKQSQPERPASPQALATEKPAPIEKTAPDDESEYRLQEAVIQQHAAEMARAEQLLREREQRALGEKLAMERAAAEKTRQELVMREQHRKALLDKQEQERLAAVKSRQEQLAHEQEQHALGEKLAIERAAAEKTRQEQVMREQHRKALLEKQEQERLAAVKAHQEQLAREQEQRALGEKLAMERAAVEKARQEQLIRDQHRKSLLEKQEQERLAAIKARQEQLAREQEKRALGEKLARERRADEQARQELQAREKLLLAAKVQEEAVRTRARETHARERAAAMLAAALPPRPSTGLSPAVNQTIEKRPAPTPATPAGVTAPLLKGDLKLVVTGKRSSGVTITYKPLVMTRRRPLQEVRMVPLVAAPRNQVQEFVIERAVAGVYTISIAADTIDDISCLLKLHEGTERMVTRDLGRQPVSVKKVLLKVLMPEGILWEDEKAFTGSIEDSDSVTKFNGQTGLTWKEYK